MKHPNAYDTVRRWLKNAFPTRKNRMAECDEEMDFEDAIAATGFGKFHILLMVFTMLGMMSSNFDTGTISYVITSAECDLKLSLLDKGQLNGITHLGMITSSFLSGYLADTLGRRNILLYGYLLDGLCNFIAGFSQNFMMLASLKFMSGFLICGPSTVILSCLSEFFSESLRPVIMMYIGICYSFGSFVIPFLAWALMSNPVEINVVSMFVIHGWQVFLIVCSAIPLMAGICAIMIPESPKFLISRGRIDEALQVLNKIYIVNHGNPQNKPYPVKALKTNHKKTVDQSTVENCPNQIKFNEKEGTLKALLGGWNQLKPLLLRPNIANLLLTIAIEFGCGVGFNTLKMWLPQLFKIMTENIENQDLCEMLALKNTTNVNEFVYRGSDDCTPIAIDSQLYINSAIVAAVQIVICGISSAVINIVGKKSLLIAMLSLGGASCITIYWCTSIEQATILVALSIGLSSTGSMVLFSILVDLFPTSLRAMASSTTLTFGRFGSIIGNVTFPLLLVSGCLPPFLTYGSIFIGAALISWFLPKTEKETF